MRNSTFTFQPPRIKKFVRQNPLIGKMKYEVSAMLAMSVELFLRDIFKNAQQISCERGAESVEVKHLKIAMQKYPNLKIQDCLDEFAEAEPFQMLLAVEKKPKAQCKGRKKKNTISILEQPVSPIRDIEIQTECNNEEFAF